jgi:aminoglycoside 6'-N-acetyltransferase I
MMRNVWPDASPSDFVGETVLVVEREEGGLGGAVIHALRPWAEGCESMPVPYIEGWYVTPDLRRTGVGRALIAAVEEWARSNGFTELGSDVELDNDVSLRAHEALGFEPTLRVQFFRKKLG